MTFAQPDMVSMYAATPGQTGTGSKKSKRSAQVDPPPVKITKCEPCCRIIDCRTLLIIFYVIVAHLAAVKRRKDDEASDEDLQRPARKRVLFEHSRSESQSTPHLAQISSH